MNENPPTPTIPAAHPPPPLGVPQFAGLAYAGSGLDVDACDGYVVLVIDGQLGEVDSYGPYGRRAAEGEVTRRREAIEVDGLDDVAVQLARFHWPPDRCPPIGHDRTPTAADEDVSVVDPAHG